MLNYPLVSKFIETPAVAGLEMKAGFPINPTAVKS